MTDIQYIRAFANSDQLGMRHAYYALKDSFFWHIRSHCTQLNMNYLEDVYQEAFIRLQTNILNARLTESNLECSLQTYLNGIGYFVAMEMVRDQKEVIEGSSAWETVLNQLEQQAAQDTDEARYGLQALWIYEVENAFTKWCNTHPNSSSEEKSEEFDRLTDAFTDKHCSKNKRIPLPDDYDEEVDPMEEILQREREKVIRSAVEEMGEPCSTILVGSFWEEKTPEELTVQLQYSSKDVTKNQKSRCLKKLKDFVVNQLRKFGYDY